MNASLPQVRIEARGAVTAGVIDPLTAQRERFETLIEALRDPGVYPHETGRIEVVETHISTIVLTGSIAYKLKKPLALGFLDFSSPQRRKFFCEEEVRLNQRLAPELYLDVVTFTGSPSTPLMRSHGDGFEYAVRMRQFDQDQLIPAVLSRGELDSDQVIRLAEVIAAFHTDQAAPLDPHADYGTRARILTPMLENFAQIRDLLPEADYEHRLRKLERWTRTEIHSLDNVITGRRDGGFIRECHGDLHLNNIVMGDHMGDEGVLIFDGIEFSPALRWIDTSSEIAFTVMDFEHHRAPAFANTLLNAYLEATDDYGALRMLGIYKAYRALVRAKVLAIRAHQDATAVAADFEHLIALAESYMRRKTPRLFLMHGFSASGKSWVAEQLVAHHGLVRLRSDYVRKRLAGLQADAPSISQPGGGLYTPERTAQTYERLCELAETILSTGNSVVVDATFLQQQPRALFRELATRLGVELNILDVQAGDEDVSRRLAQRARDGRTISEADTSIVQRQRQTAEAFDASEQPLVVTIDNRADRPAASLIESLEHLFAPSA